MKKYASLMNLSDFALYLITEKEIYEFNDKQNYILSVDIHGISYKEILEIFSTWYNKIKTAQDFVNEKLEKEKIKYKKTFQEKLKNSIDDAENAFKLYSNINIAFQVEENDKKKKIISTLEEFREFANGKILLGEFTPNENFSEEILPFLTGYLRPEFNYLLNMIKNEENVKIEEKQNKLTYDIPIFVKYEKNKELSILGGLIDDTLFFTFSKNIQEKFNNEILDLSKVGKIFVVESVLTINLNEQSKSSIYFIAIHKKHAENIRIGRSVES